MTEPGFSDSERRALESVLDEIIPQSSDGKLPGAGALGISAHIEEALGQAPELRPLIAQGLAGITESAGRRGAESFEALSKEDKLEVMNELAAEPAFLAFLPSLIFHTYVGYYQNARVVEGLGLEPRPPYPLGYTIEETDLESLLETVRKRPKLYREC
jgi:hypothetical protein